MPNKNAFEIRFDGLEGIVSALESLADDIDEKVDAVLTKLALKIIHDAKRLAPIDSGDLESALVVGEVKQLIGVSYIDLGASPEVNDYAMVQHEGFRKTAKGTLVTLTPGEKTRSKGSHGGYQPGKKYLENALKMNEDLILEELSKVLGGGS